MNYSCHSYPHTHLNLCDPMTIATLLLGFTISTNIAHPRIFYSNPFALNFHFPELSVMFLPSISARALGKATILLISIMINIRMAVMIIISTLSLKVTFLTILLFLLSLLLSLNFVFLLFLSSIYLIFI